MKNRVIKFRAFDINTKQWVGIEALYLGVLGQELELETKRSGIKIMQFTGLLDKNGKEIYEGDIVKSSRNIGRVFWCKNSGAWRVDYNNYFLSTEVQKIEIIGNRFENPELLIN